MFLHWTGSQGANQIGMVTAGDNTYLQLGRGTITINETLFGRIDAHDGDYSWNSVGAGERHTYAVRSDNTLWLAGFSSNFDQQGTDTNWTKAASGNAGSSLLLKSNGTIWYSHTSQEGSDTDWTDVASGGGFYAGLKSGSLYTWGGSNLYGQLGRTSSPTPYSDPGQVGSATDWTQMALGRDFTIMLNSSGELYATGRNNIYQLGLNDTTDRTTLTQIGTDTDWAFVAAGTTYCYAIKTNGNLYRWGGGFGQTPTSFNTAITWDKVTVGLQAQIGLDTNGIAYVWGANTQGQLGLGLSTSYGTLSDPTPIVYSSTATVIESGNNHSIIVFE